MARPKGSKTKKATPQVAVAQEIPQAEQKGTMTVAEAGQKGGSTTSQKYGTDFYTEIGSIGGTVRGLRNEERDIRNKAWENNELPDSYKSLVNEVFQKTQLFRLMAQDYIPKLFKTLKDAGFDDLKAKAVVFWDASQIWTERRVYQVFSQHPELKHTLDARKQAAGELGGSATAAAIETATERKDEIVGTSPASGTPTLAEAPRPEGAPTAEEQNNRRTEEHVRVSSVKLNIVRLEAKLMDALYAAHNMKSTHIELVFNVEGEVTDIVPVPPEEAAKNLVPATTKA